MAVPPTAHRYRWLLRLLPRTFRDDWERDLVADWREQERASTRRVAFWRRAVADALGVGAREYVTAAARNLGVAARRLRRAPAFTAAAVLTLALGIGATTGLFALVDAVLLQPLPWASPDRVGLVWAVPPDGQPTWLSMPELDDLSRLSPRLAGIAGVTDVRFALAGRSGTEEVQGLAVSHGLLRLLGVAPALGRDFARDDDRPEAAPVVLLSDALWRSRFGADAGVMGRSITLDERAYRVVGVLPARFSLLPPTSVLPEHIDLLVPLEPAPASRQRSVRFLHALARLRPGATFAEVDAELRGRGSALTRSFPDAYPGGGWTFSVVSFERDVLRQARSALGLLAALVVLVLALACVNVAHLMVARQDERRTDLAVRTALGASAAQLAGEQLAETSLIALAAGALGLALAGTIPPALRAIDPGALPRLADASIGPRVFLFAGVLIAATAISAAAASALARRWLVARVDGSRSGGRTRAGARLARALVVLQTAGATTILIAAVFLADALARLQRVEIGVRADGLVTARVSLSPRYPIGPQAVAFFERATEALAARPGVAGAAAISQLPLSGALLGSTFVDAARGPDARVDVDLRAITPAWFDVAGTPIVAGRRFGPGDSAAAPRVAIVDETLARRLAPGGPVIGRRVRWIRQPEVDVAIVGVVGAVRHRGATEPPRPTVYRPLAQYPRSAMFLAARLSPGQTLTHADLQAAVGSVDRSPAVADVATMPARVARSMARPRGSTWLAAALAALAVVLATVGVYGVLSVGVAARRREFGVRLAIGARPRSVLARVLGEGLILAAAGIAIGTLGGAALIGLARAALPAAEANPAAACAAGAIAVLACAAVALWVPARRAAAVDPRIVLQAD
jgi:putative ABC transport system permease protein